MTQSMFNKFAWGGVIGSIVISIFSWASRVDWQISSLTAYQWFPLFGLTAWTVMCTHYYTGFLRMKNKGLEKPRGFSKITGGIVLASLLLHPGILAAQQSKNGQGTPIESYVSYVGEGLRLAIMLGVLSLVVFLSFEVFNRMKNNKTIKKIWPAISISQSLAMTLVFVHGLRLGSDLGDGWFRLLWMVYGAALLPCFYLFHKADFSKN